MNRIAAIMVMGLFLMTSPSLPAGENCSQLGARCRDACGQTETQELGAFEDCGEKQVCCSTRDPALDAVRCCILSFDSRSFGPTNCSTPVNGLCNGGAGSPLFCEKLAACRGAQ